MDATRVSPRRFTKELVDERAPSPPSLQMLLHHPEPKPELHTRVSPTREHTHTRTGACGHRQASWHGFADGLVANNKPEELATSLAARLSRSKRCRYTSLGKPDTAINKLNTQNPHPANPKPDSYKHLTHSPCAQIGHTLATKYLYIERLLRPKYVLFGYMDR